MRDTITKKELDHFLEVLKRLIMDIEICSSNLESIIKAIEENSLKISNIEKFLSHYVYLSYSYCTISIYKMFKPEEKRSFQKLFNKLSEFRYDSELSELLQKNNLAENCNDLFVSKLDVQISIKELGNFISTAQILIDKILARRNTFHAHYDPAKTDAPESLADLLMIKEIAKKVYDKLSGGFYDKTFLFTNYYWSVDSVINDSIDLYDIYKKMEDDLERLV